METVGWEGVRQNGSRKREFANIPVFGGTMDLDDWKRGFPPKNQNGDFAMRVLLTAFLSAVLAAGATSAWGQFGSYGSPEMLQLAPSARPAQWAPTGVPVTYAQPAPVAYQQYQPRQTSPPVVYVYPTRPYAGMAPAAPSNPGQLTPVPEPVGPSRQGPSRQGPLRQGPLRQGPLQQLPPQQGLVSSPGGADYLNSEVGDDCCGTGCEETCCAPVCCPWYGAAMGLMMCRNQGNRVWTSYETGRNYNQDLNSQMGLQWKGGAEVTVGRRFCCNCWALEATYWALDEFQGFDEVSEPPGTVSSTINFDYLQFGPGDPLSIYFNTSAAHRVWRYDEIHNLEINLIRQRMMTGCNVPWDVSWSAGIRWFRFQESFLFGAVEEGYAWGDAGGSWEAYLQDDITNDLVGIQFGGEANYYMFGCWRFFVAPQIGLYNNHIRNRFNLYRGDGLIAQEIEPDLDGTYPVNSSKDILSFMTEVDIGFDWQFCNRWSARVGYRVMFISGIGLAEEQITPYAVDIPEIADIDHNATLILHGAFAGLTYNF